MEVLNYSETTFEKLPVTIFEKSEEGAISVAHDRPINASQRMRD